MIISDNFFQYAMKHYDNPQCKTAEEFNEDLQKIVYIKKLLSKDEVNIRLMLNHIITLYNVFDRYACSVMLFYKIDEEFWSKLKTYLVYLDLMPEHIPELNLVSSNIPLNQDIVKELRLL